MPFLGGKTKLVVKSVSDYQQHWHSDRGECHLHRISENKCFFLWPYLLSWVCVTGPLLAFTELLFVRRLEGRPPVWPLPLWVCVGVQGGAQGDWWFSRTWLGAPSPSLDAICFGSAPLTSLRWRGAHFFFCGHISFMMNLYLSPT